VSARCPSRRPRHRHPVAITYRPVWPANAPELRVAETLTLPKFGLPAVLNQTSANILYQQSIAADGPPKPSVVLHDPIREKTFALGAPAELARLPASDPHHRVSGQNLLPRPAPHLQSRFFYDPLRGTKGSLVLVGKFVDEIAGEDYLNSTSSPRRQTALEDLAASDTDRSPLARRHRALTTDVETFIEDPLKAGTYKSNGAPVRVGSHRPRRCHHSDTAVADYALTATGTGSRLGHDGLRQRPRLHAHRRSRRPASFQSHAALYTGELKVLPPTPSTKRSPAPQRRLRRRNPRTTNSNGATLRPQDGVAPGVYTYAITSRLATAWQLVQSPAGASPRAPNTPPPSVTTLPRGVTINAPNASPAAPARPGLVARSEGRRRLSPPACPRRSSSAPRSPTSPASSSTSTASPRSPTTPPRRSPTPSASTGLVPGGLSAPIRGRRQFLPKRREPLEVALYSTADLGTSSGIDFRLHASTETDLVVAGGSPWQTPNGTLPQPNRRRRFAHRAPRQPLLVMSDNYFTMRYRPKTASAASPPTSPAPAGPVGCPPKLVEGWIKRVLAGINPFNQRVSDLYNNAVNTDVSLLTQAGKRWEGNIALSLENINDFGLIEIYETVLNRGKNISIDSGYDYAPANDALLLAAGYLNDLYTILGNEAYADAANPTISVDDSTLGHRSEHLALLLRGPGESVLEEELALLRGRDDFLSPASAPSPAYNRLYWNYTRGINSGEALYATNYNIREKAGSPTANGTLDAADAQRMFPQGHGDAYGHYLTALKGYTTPPHQVRTSRGRPAAKP
jgi:hypothetical protein